jgi:uncharacterized OB-fold protein
MPTSVIKRYYDALAEGTIVARKCRRCEALTFPPTTACERCGRDELDWTEFSGKGKLLYLSHGAAPPPNPAFNDLAPYCYGHILLDEGVYVQGIVTNVAVDPAVLADIFERGPIDVEADIIDVGGLPVLAFKTS